MEVSFHTPRLREHWLDPQGEEVGAATTAIAKQMLEDIAAAASPHLLEFAYEVSFQNGSLTFSSEDRVVITCSVDPSRVRQVDGDAVDLTQVTRVQVMSIDKIGGAS